jgi:hypothetical protein
MRQRGRKSEAATNTPLSVDGSHTGLQPPLHLTTKEARLFREVIANAPKNQFSLTDTYLLSTFSQITVLLQDAAIAATKADKDTHAQKLKALNDLAKTQINLCTKLRLTTQSRTHAATVGRAQANKHPPSFYDTMRLEDWQ